MVRIYLIFAFILIGQLFSQNFPYFDGGRAYEYLKMQCDLGPRFPGSNGHEKFIEILTPFLDSLSGELILHHADVKHPFNRGDVELTNLFARFNPELKKRIMFMAHWDTREIADKDELLLNQSKPILGANDGASGVAVLMVVAEILHANPPSKIGIDILFVDGEDMGNSGNAESFGLGTREFAKNYPIPRPEFAVCLDMVGDSDLEINIERFSYYQAPQYVDKVWTLAQKLGLSAFRHRLGPAVYDDHRVLFLETGIPAINIIDFSYPNENKNYWHTLQDIPENCSAESLETVGTLITALIYSEDKQ